MKVWPVRAHASVHQYVAALATNTCMVLSQPSPERPWPAASSSLADACEAGDAERGGGAKGDGGRLRGGRVRAADAPAAVEGGREDATAPATPRAAAVRTPPRDAVTDVLLPVGEGGEPVRAAIVEAEGDARLGGRTGDDATGKTKLLWRQWHKKRCRNWNRPCRQGGSRSQHTGGQVLAHAGSVYTKLGISSGSCSVAVDFFVCVQTAAEKRGSRSPSTRCL